MKNDSVQYIGVVGYGWSGSSAVVDLLKEYEGNWVSEVEFRILTDSHGMMDLEHALLEKWDAQNVDIAIQDFLDFAKFLNQNEGKFSRGMCYDKLFGGKFMKATEKFVEEIADYTYESYWWMYDYRKSYGKWIVQKILNKIIPQNYVETMYFSDISRDEFYLAVKRYMKNLIEIVSHGKNGRNIILDQAIHPQHVLKAFDYFDNVKVIIVDRDPRDSYCDILELKKLLGRDIAFTHDVSKYVKWHKKYRENNNIEHENILRIQFEDLIFSYEETVKKITDFIGDEAMMHVEQFKHFDPMVSRKNIGKYKTFPYQDEIRILEKELAEYLYPLEK